MSPEPSGRPKPEPVGRPKVDGRTLLAIRIPGFSSWFPFALGLVIVIAVAVLTARQVLLNQQQNERVRHTFEVLEVGQDLQISIIDATNAQRGLLLSDAGVFRTRMEDGLRRIDSQLAQLRQLTADNPGQGPRLDVLAAALRDRAAEMRRVDALYASGAREEAADRSVLALQQAMVVRDQLNEVLSEERRLLADRSGRADRSSNVLLWLSTGGLLLAALLVGFSIAALRRRAFDLQQANEIVMALNSELEARVAARTAALADANADIRRFAYIVSHDLRSPLVNIMGFTAELAAANAESASLLARVGDAARPSEREAIETDIPEALGFIRASTQRMDGLIKAILELSRAGRRPLAAEEVDLAALFASLAVTQQSQIEQTGTSLVVGPLPAIRSDRFSLEQLFGNLLDNAVKYLRPGVPGKISVTAADKGQMVELTVADNGRGISERDQERVFELFRRAGPQDRPGDGVGLAHVRALAHRLGGQISVSSIVGEGSRFVVCLPRDLDDAGLGAGLGRRAEDGDDG